MTAFLGGILIILGSAGGAFCICADDRRRIFLLKRIQMLYEQMQYEISYGKVPIPNLLRNLSQKKNMIFEKEFQQIASQMCASGKEFEEIWKSNLQGALDKTPLKKQEKELLLCFPEKQGFLEKDAQARALDELLRELQRKITELEEAQKSKNKMVMGIGLASGMLLTILLL